MVIMPIIPYIGGFFPFMRPLSLDRYQFYFLLILKETPKFLSLSNPVLQYAELDLWSSVTDESVSSLLLLCCCLWLRSWCRHRL